MKRLSLLAIASLTMLACKTEPVKDYTIISGKINNLQKPEVVVAGLNTEQKLTVKPDGTFKDTLRINEGYYTLFGGGKRIAMFIDKGDDINLSFDVKDTTNTINFKGVKAKENTYLSKKGKLKNDLFGSPQALYALNETEFLTKMNGIKEKVTAMIEGAGLSPEFKKQELQNLEYNHITNVSRYPTYHGYFTQNKEFKASEKFPDLTKGLDLNNEKHYKLSSGYRELVNKSIQNIVSKKSDDSKTDFGLEFMKTAKEKVTAPYILEDLLYKNAKYEITYTENLSEFYKMFNENVNNPKYKNEITETYNKLKKTAKGEPSPKFVNYENYKGGTTSLDDLKGKYVYIDVWATWCGPCKREIPSLKKVEKQYHNKNIEFVSMSIDRRKDHEKWKAMVKDKELGGIQLFADKDWNSQFVKDYSIKGIPRFILIDPEGKIVSANAPRPSSPKLVELFNKLKI